MADPAFVDAAVSVAAGVVAAEDRSRLAAALAAAEVYVASKSREVFLSGPSAMRSLMKHPVKPEDYVLELHAPVPNTHARAMADKIQKAITSVSGSKTEDIPLEDVVRVRTVIFNERITIGVGSRDIVRLTLLPRAAGARSADVIQSVSVSPAFTRENRRLRSFGPDLILIQIYDLLCDPVSANSWADAAGAERSLRQRLLKEAWKGGGESHESHVSLPIDEGLPLDEDERAAWGDPAGVVGGGRQRRSRRERGERGGHRERGERRERHDPPVRVTPILAARLLKAALEGYASGAGRVLVGDAAVDWKKPPRRLSFVATGTLGDEEVAVRRALTPYLSAGYELQGMRHELFVPVDPRARRLTISVVSLETGARRPLIDVYNLPQYKLCPHFEAYHPGSDGTLKIGTLPLVLRILMCELWVVHLLKKAGRLKPGAAAAAIADTLNSIRVAGKKLDLRLLGKKEANRLPAYDLVFPTERRWYIGQIHDEELAAKRAQLRAGAVRRAGNYYPIRQARGGDDDSPTMR